MCILALALQIHLCRGASCGWVGYWSVSGVDSNSWTLPDFPYHHVHSAGSYTSTALLTVLLIKLCLDWIQQTCSVPSECLPLCHYVCHVLSQQRCYLHGHDFCQSVFSIHFQSVHLWVMLHQVADWVAPISLCSLSSWLVWDWIDSQSSWSHCYSVAVLSASTSTTQTLSRILLHSVCSVLCCVGSLTEEYQSTWAIQSWWHSYQWCCWRPDLDFSSWTIFSSWDLQHLESSLLDSIVMDWKDSVSHVPYLSSVSVTVPPSYLDAPKEQVCYLLTWCLRRLTIHPS